MAKRHHNSHHERRNHEMHDEGMIHENHSEVANLPQEVMMKPWPKDYDYLPEGLNDGISGIDKQMERDNSMRRKHNVPKKV